MELGRAIARAQRRKTVGEEWVGWLPPKKAEAFAATKFALYADSWMLEVALDEGLGLSRQGSPANSFELALICSDLFARLAARLEAALRALHQNSQNFGILPSMAPLDAGFFRTESARNRAWRSRLFSRILRNSSQFALKLDDLVVIVCNLAAEFRPVAGQIGHGCAANPEGSWDRLEALEYDLNTCLGETLVVLKSFLHVLPEGDAHLFQHYMDTAIRTSAKLAALTSAAANTLEKANPAETATSPRRRTRNSSI